MKKKIHHLLMQKISDKIYNSQYRNRAIHRSDNSQNNNGICNHIQCNRKVVSSKIINIEQQKQLNMELSTEIINKCPVYTYCKRHKCINILCNNIKYTTELYCEECCI